jgi:hypothetical protein
VYRLSAPLHFGPEDSGKQGHQVIWQAHAGATPILSGATQITGWTQSDVAKNIWRAAVPEGLRTRQLYIDGKRIPVAQGAPPVALSGNPDGYEATDATYATWRNPSQLEFVYPGGVGAWTEPRCPVGDVSGSHITMAQPCWTNITRRPNVSLPALPPFNMSTSVAPSRIENAYELMQPGQYYLDSSEHALFYRAPAGRDLTQADVEAPQLERLLVGEGTLDAPVHDLVFSGLTFAYATWNLPSTRVGFAEVQANLTITADLDEPYQATCQFSMPAGTCPFGAYTREPGNVSWHAADHVQFVRNKFQHLGAAGLVFEYGSHANRIEGNIFEDISGNGVQLGDANDAHPEDVMADEREILTGNVIANNVVRNVGVEYHGAVGILLFVSRNTTIQNNEIHDVPYTAISSGALAGHADVPENPDTTTNVNADNDISGNVIYHYMTLLNDGGAIYLEGHQHETLRNPDGSVDADTNYAHGLHAVGNVAYHQGGTGNAYYNDIGSQWLTWSNNVQWQASSANGGCLPVGHLRFIGNYHSDPVAEFGCGAPIDTHYADNTVIPRLPLAADLPPSLLGAAGLTADFHSITEAEPPQLEYAQPNSGRARRETRVLVGGSGFGPSATVTWNGLAATSLELLSSNFLIASAPAGAELAKLTIVTAGGTARLLINDTDPAIAYSGAWTNGRDYGNYQDDTQHVAEENGAAFSYRFEGAGIEFISAQDTNRGEVDVFIDNELVTVASCFATSLSTRQVCARVQGLPAGSHTLKVVKRSGRYLTLDALHVLDSDGDPG